MFAGETKKIPSENGWRFVQEDMQRIADLEGNGIATNKCIVIEIRHPTVPSIDLVDLPGIVGQPTEKAEKIEKIIERQLDQDQRNGNHSMFLAVVPASARPNSNMALSLVQKKQLQKRTIGVFSKCDEISQKDVLRALVMNEPLDGDSPETLGGVELKSCLDLF